ncbi:MAG TPA: PASTA domain-containing protein [Candidatus Hydrogenedentes bacterium]|nr:PASTA domain-containing protein [Candidatus Hydrogenedentota bacterium]
MSTQRMSVMVATILVAMGSAIGFAGAENPVTVQKESVETLSHQGKLRAVVPNEETVTLTIAVTGTGSTAPEPGAYEYSVGQMISINAVPTSGSGWAFDHWEGDIGSADPGSINITITMDQNKTVTAVFLEADWTLTLQKTGNGETYPVSGEYAFFDGDTVNVNANIIADGDAFDQWTGDLMNGTDAQNAYQEVTMDQNRSLTAQFVPGDWTLTISTAGSGIGNISPGIGVFSYLAGRTAFVNANTSSENYFAGWTGDVTTYNPSLNITMEGNKAITANYAESGYALTVASEGQGWVDPTGAFYLASNTEPILRAYPAFGYMFSEWTGDLPTGADAGNPELPVLMDQDRSLTAHFVQITYTLTLILEGEGTTTPPSAPDPGFQYEYTPGDLVEIEASLGTDGWAFSHWTGDIGGNSSASRSLSIAMDQNRTITVHYVPADWTLTIGFTGDGDTWPAPGSYGFINGSYQRILPILHEGGDAFDHWDGLPAGHDPLQADQTVVISGDLNLTAVFVTGDVFLTTNVAGDGTTEYLSHPAGVYAFKQGQYAPLEVRLASDSFWGGFSGDLNTYDLSYSLLMDADKSVTYNLATSGYHLVVNQSGGGSINPSGTIGYAAGATPAIHAINVGNKVFTQWTGDLPDGVDPSDPDPVILMDQDRTITATFETGNWYLYLQAMGNGTTDPSPAQYWFMDGQAFEVTAIPGTDEFNHWMGDVPEGQDPASLTLSGIMDRNRELIAIFTPSTVTVPDLSGKTADQAASILAVLGLSLGEVSQEYSDTIPVDYVISQTPEAGVIVAYGSTVDIVVSLGHCYTQVPNLGGLTQEEAESALESASLILGTVTQEYNDFVPEGQIIEQNPVYGLVILCDSPVNIVISLGHCYAQVPALIGLTQAEAQTALEAASLVLGTVTQEYSDLAPEGQIIGQTPAQDSTVSCGDPVNIVISLGHCYAQVPALIGLTQAEAQAALEAAALVLGTITQEYSDLAPEGQIIQQDPAQDSVLSCGDPVNIVISLGLCYAQVPDLAGLTQTEAQTTLEAVSLTLGMATQDYNDLVPEGQIIQQNPAAGSEVPCEAAVDIVVSLGPSYDGLLMVDQDGDSLVSLSELFRIIQFYNSDSFHCDASTEDGYDIGPGDTTCTPYDSDYSPQDWRITVHELLRVIQFYNSGGYHYCPDDGTEDGFCPGQAR